MRGRCCQPPDCRKALAHGRAHHRQSRRIQSRLQSRLQSRRTQRACAAFAGRQVEIHVGSVGEDLCSDGDLALGWEQIEKLLKRVLPAPPKDNGRPTMPDVVPSHSGEIRRREEAEAVLHAQLRKRCHLLHRAKLLSSAPRFPELVYQRLCVMFMSRHVRPSFVRLERLLCAKEGGPVAALWKTSMSKRQSLETDTELTASAHAFPNIHSLLVWQPEKLGANRGKVVFRVIGPGTLIFSIVRLPLRLS